MKIAIISDTHLGYTRFYEDSFRQAENAFLDAERNADVILFAGDLFDTKIPKLEDLEKAMSILKNLKKPVFAIHGNHERRTKGMVNPVKLLAQSGMINYIHNNSLVFPAGGQKIQIAGIGSVPEEYAENAIRKFAAGFEPCDDAFKVLIIHQTLQELVPHSGNELSVRDIEHLPFDLIINGHIHKRTSMLGGRLIVPGSTVITQLRKEESEPKGYMLYDTTQKRVEFRDIGARNFIHMDLDFEDAGEEKVNNRIKESISEARKSDPDALIAIKLKGTLKEGLSGSDIKIPNYDKTFIDNRLNSENLAAKIRKIKNLRDENLSMKDLAVSELSSKVSGNITLFDPVELFDKLIEGTDVSMEYLDNEVMPNRKEKDLNPSLKEK
jgi:DNA repair exonuclease SbcCD nuclease subunit